MLGCAPVGLALCRAETRFLLFSNPLSVQLFSFEPLVEVLRYSNGWSIQPGVALSQDESVFVTHEKSCTTGNSIAIYSCLQPLEKCPFDSSERYCSATLSPSGAFAVLLTKENSLQLWDVERSNLVHERCNSSAEHLWSHDEKFLALKEAENGL